MARSLEGNWREDVVFELRQAVEQYQFAQRQMQGCDEQLKQYLSALPSALPRPRRKEEGGSGSDSETARPAKKATRGNAPSFDVRGELQRIAGVDLTSIEGINVMTAQTILSEVGVDLSRFASENHFVSWLGLTPSHDISGGKVIGRGRRKVQNRVAMSLRMAASTLRNSPSYLGARYRYLCRKLPSKASAVKAMARYLGILVYRMLTKGPEWVDRGAAAYEQKRGDAELASLSKRAAAKGYGLVPKAGFQPSAIQV